MIRAFSFLPALMVAACGQEVPQVDDPHNIVVNGEEMSQADFLDKYCIGKESNPTCSKVLDAATRNLIDKARNSYER
ncbi:hypothetical protein SAMN05216404_11373 [Nitrosospira multiformis]|uniref:Uncharacterized protein n=1 Tax=Nitrosospira multiformis TaxID=1231 RepID=A0A1H8MQT5_9PROT|nr:hypothetical protein [Nitrosospira multiformis]SEO19593.1 hypothetical protein SAMN05216404_11373 [Nitrosospira multiformis]